MNVGYAVLALIVYALAIARLTRLINGDKITDRLRTYPAGRKIAAERMQDEALSHGQVEIAERAVKLEARWDRVLYFVGCPWCVSMWLAFGTTWALLWFHDHPVVRYIAVALAVSHLIGVCARFADTEEIDIEPDDDAA